MMVRDLVPQSEAVAYENDYNRRSQFRRDKFQNKYLSGNFLYDNQQNDYNNKDNWRWNALDGTTNSNDYNLHIWRNQLR